MARLRSVVPLALLLTVYGCHRVPRAYVECGYVASVDGMVCTIEHRGGDGPAHACWDVLLTCRNGVRVSGHACGDAEPGAKSSVVMPASAFGEALQRCDTVASASVNARVVR
jgi:hypothetical protein